MSLKRGKQVTGAARSKPPIACWRLSRQSRPRPSPPPISFKNGQRASRRIGDVARLLDTTIDRLRNWERNGLLTVPRDPRNGYRLYGAEEIGRLRVIRMLIQSRYSTMSILRMLTHLDAGETEGLKTTLDTPDPGEDVLYATDRWLTALSRLRESALEVIAYIEAWLQREDVGEKTS